MIIISFFKTLSNKSKNYLNVWSFILSKMEIDKSSSISIFEVSTQTKISVKTIYRILSFGFKFLVQNKFEYVFYLKNNNIIIDLKNNVGNDIIQAKILKEPRINNKKPKEKPSSFPIRKKTKYNTEVIDLILNYLNSKTNKSFSSTNQQTCKIITARFQEGFKLEQFYYVIDIKTTQWLNNDSERFLRPLTLFGENMESYVNEKQPKQKKNYLQNNYDAASSAKNLLRGSKSNQNS